MSVVPGFLLRHRVQVEEYEGSNARGDVYSAPQEVRCLMVENPRLVRNKQGDEVRSSTSYIAKPDHFPAEGSKVTTPSGDRRTVVSVKRVTAPGLPTPDNTEVFLN